MRFIIFLSSLFILSAEPKTQLEVTIKNLKTDIKGNLRLGVFEKNGFPIREKAIAGKILPVVDKQMKLFVELKSSGIYAICIIQDQDKNNILTKNLVGYPTEPYGFSNNKFGKFGPPDFEEVSFKIEAGETKKLVINLKH